MAGAVLGTRAAPRPHPARAREGRRAPRGPRPPSAARPRDPPAHAAAPAGQPRDAARRPARRDPRERAAARGLRRRLGAVGLREREGRGGRLRRGDGALARPPARRPPGVRARLPRDLAGGARGAGPGVVDIIMSGTRASTRLAAQVAYSQPYAEETLAFLVGRLPAGRVRDHRRAPRAAAADRRAAGPGVARGAAARAARGRGRAGAVSIRDFVREDDAPRRDAHLVGAGLRVGLLYPELAPVALEPRPGSDGPRLRSPARRAGAASASSTPGSTSCAATSASPRPAGTGSSARPRGRRRSAGRSARDVLGWWKD